MSTNFFADTVVDPQTAAGNFFADTVAGPPTDEQELSVITRTNTPTQETPVSFSLTEIGGDVVRGMANYVASFPQNFGSTLIQLGETARETGAKSPWQMFAGSLKQRVTERAMNVDEPAPAGALLLDILASEKDAALFLASGNAPPEKIVSSGKELIRQNKEYLEKMGLARKGDDGLAFDAGNAFSNILVTVGAAFATKSPALASSIMGYQTNSQDYLEARKIEDTGTGKKLNPSEASAASAIDAGVIAMLEAIGGKITLGLASTSGFLKKVIARTMTQGAEEASQEAASNVVKETAGIRDRSLSDIINDVGYSAAVGVIAGAPVSTLFTHLESRAAAEGLPEEALNKIKENVLTNKDELIDSFAMTLDKEMAGVLNEEPTRKAVIDVINEQVKLADDAIKAAQKGETQDARIAAKIALMSGNLTEQQRADLLKVTNPEQLEDVAAIVENKVSPFLSPEFDSDGQRVLAEDVRKINASLRRLSDKVDVIATGKTTSQLVGEVRKKTPNLSLRLRESIADELKSNGISSPIEIDRLQALAFEKIPALNGSGGGSSLPPPPPTPPSGVGDMGDEFRKRLLTAARAPKRTVRNKAKNVLIDLQELSGRLATPISTRLKNVNPKLEARLRRFEYELRKTTNEDKAVAMPFLRKWQKLPEEDRIFLDFALKNGDAATSAAIADKYGMTAELAAVREMLQSIYVRAKDVGLDIGYLENYFPRIVSEPKKLLAYFYGEVGELRDAIATKEIELGRHLTEEEKAHLINTLIRGYGDSQIRLKIPSNVKEREIFEVTPEIFNFYESSDRAVVAYITSMNEAIESRKFLGHKKKADLTENIEDSIGAFAIKELEAGNILPAQEAELKKIMMARFKRKEMLPFWRVYRNISYIDTMGSTISAITQLGDLAFSLYKNGVYRTVSSIPRAIANKSQVTREDIGIDNIAEEFSGNSLSSQAVTKIFKITGLDWMDRLGKETFINSSLKRFQAQAKKPSQAFRKSLEVVFEEQTDSVIKDLQSGYISENVKLLLFNDLLNMQPIALSEMPETYLRGGNLRIFYMLKTFTVKQIDVYRREVFSQFSTNPLMALKNLTSLVAFFVLMNAGADFLKDLVLNRDTPIEEHVVNNILRLFGITKFQVYTARKEGVGTSVYKTILPPAKLIDSASKDINKAIKNGEVDWNNLRSVDSIPLVGKFYFWWYGFGSQSNKPKKSTSSL